MLAVSTVCFQLVLATVVRAQNTQLAKNIKRVSEKLLRMRSEEEKPLEEEKLLEEDRCFGRSEFGRHFR